LLFYITIFCPLFERYVIVAQQSYTVSFRYQKELLMSAIQVKQRCSLPTNSKLAVLVASFILIGGMNFLMMKLKSIQMNKNEERF